MNNFEISIKGDGVGVITHVITSDSEYDVWYLHSFVDGVWRPRRTEDFDKREYKRAEVEEIAILRGSTGVHAEGMPKGKYNGKHKAFRGMNWKQIYLES